MKLLSLLFEQLTRARFSRAFISRLATSFLTLTLTLPALTLYALGFASASTTWKSVTGSNSNAPVPSSSKLYNGATADNRHQHIGGIGDNAV